MTAILKGGFSNPQKLTGKVMIRVELKFAGTETVAMSVGEEVNTVGKEPVTGTLRGYGVKLTL